MTNVMDGRMGLPYKSNFIYQQPADETEIKSVGQTYS